MAITKSLLRHDDELPDGWQKCLRKEKHESSQEIRYVPSRPLHFVMMALCFINTFSGTFLVPHCKNLSAFLGKGSYYAAFIVCAPYLTNIVAVYLSKYLVPNKGWLVASLTNCGFMIAGTALSYVALVYEPLRNPYVLLFGGLVYGMGMGQQYIGRQLGVETSSASARNKIFAQQTVATSLGILCGTSTSGLTTLVDTGDKMDPTTIALPFLILCLLATALAIAMCVVLPNQIVKVPASELSVAAAPNAKTNSCSPMGEREKKLRIWSTLVIGFNRVVVRSMVENETTAFYQKLYDYPEVYSSNALGLAYLVGIFALQAFGAVHDRLPDRTWIFITLACIMLGTVLQCPIAPEWKEFETIKFTIGLCLVLPGLATNTAVANSTATKYAIQSQWLYTQDMIGLLQIVTQTSLARIVGPFLGYVLAISSMRTTMVFQGLVTVVSWFLVWYGVGTNIAETAKGRASLRLESKGAETRGWNNDQPKP